MAELNIQRHMGVVKGTGSRIFLIFRQIPDSKEHCLVVYPDALPDSMAQNLDNIVMSREAQGEVNLYEVLNRRVLNDGSYVLQALHERKMLTKVLISDVDMVPLRGHLVPLSTINEEVDKLDVEVEENTSDELDLNANAESARAKETNDVIYETSVPNESPEEKAKNMMEQAADMKKMAESLKKAAMELDPSLTPKKGRPTLSESEQDKKDRRNEKRRAAYKAKKKKKKT